MNPDKQTWDLLIRALKSSLDDAGKLKFETWLKEAENRRFYNNLTHVWYEIQQRAASYEPDHDRLWSQLQQRIRSLEPNHPAARVPRRRTFLMRAAVIMAAVAAVVLVIIHFNPLRPVASPVEQQLCAFEGKSYARLSDGSTVWLHTGSTLTYDTNFNDEDRRVKLCGEGFFDIAKDPKHPFTVEVGDLKVCVHGTKFNVRASADNDIMVSLLEGSISLDIGDGTHRQLQPGEIARYDTETREISIECGNVAMESCWAAGKLSFEKQSLGEVCRYMARWYDTQIQIDQSLEHNYAYTFTITNEPLEEILRIMSRINPIVYTFDKDNSVSISELK